MRPFSDGSKHLASLSVSFDQVLLLLEDVGALFVLAHLANYLESKLVVIRLTRGALALCEPPHEGVILRGNLR